MMEVLKGGGSAAKIKAKSGRLLSDDDYDVLCSMNSVDEIVSFLKKKEAYRSFIPDEERGIHRGALEEYIYLSLIDDYESLYAFSSEENRRFLDLYYLKRKIWTLKSALYAIYNGDIVTKESLPSHHGGFDIDEIVKCKTVGELAAALSGTVYGEILGDGGSIFEIETKFDQYYFDIMFKTIGTAAQDEKHAARELIGTEADATNLLWIYRAKKFYNMPPEKIAKTLIKHRYNISKPLMERLIECASAEEAAALTEGTRYGELLTAVDAERENAFSAYMYRQNRRVMTRYPYSSVCGFAFLHVKRIEIQNITSVIECVRYGILPEETQNHIITCRGYPSGP